MSSPNFVLISSHILNIRASDSVLASTLCTLIIAGYTYIELATPGDGWGVWLRTGVPGRVMLAAYAPEWATKALIDIKKQFQF